MYNGVMITSNTAKETTMTNPLQREIKNTQRLIARLVREWTADSVIAAQQKYLEKLQEKVA